MNSFVFCVALVGIADVSLVNTDMILSTLTGNVLMKKTYIFCMTPRLVFETYSTIFAHMRIAQNEACGIIT